MTRTPKRVETRQCGHSRASRAIDSARAGQGKRSVVIVDRPGLSSGGGHRGTGGEPVDLVTGRFVVTKTDLILPGRIPVKIERGYRSGATNAGALSPLIRTPRPLMRYLRSHVPERTRLLVVR